MATIDVRPFGGRDSNGRATGLYTDLAAMLSFESGIEFDNSVVPYARAMLMMERDDADVIFSIPHTALARVAVPLTIAFTADIAVLGRAGTRFSKLEDLRGKVVAHLRGVEYSAEFQADVAIRKYETRNVEHTIKMLLHGRIDAVIGFSQAMAFMLRELAIPRDSLGAAFQIESRNVLLHMSKLTRREPAGEQLSAALSTLRDRGAISGLLNRYFGGLPPL